MSRTYYTQAVVLALHHFGESNREAVLLTPDNGIVRAAVYGGAKSKLRSLVAPYHSGTIWLYQDPVKHSVKVTDFDVMSFRQEIRENLTHTWAAAAAAELVIKTLGGGTETAAAFTLVNGFFEGISRTGEDGARYGLLRFFWRYLDCMGAKPDIHHCSSCETEINSSRENTGNTVLWYSHLDNTFVCPLCRQQSEPHIAVTAEVFRFLDCIDTGTMQESRSFRLSPDGYAAARHIIFTMIAVLCGAPLGSLKTAGGII